MAETPTKYKIFIASPRGLQDVRTAFRDVIDEYNRADGKHRDVEFEPVGWEDTLPGIGRPQESIDQDVRASDYFVMVLHDRWGTPPDTGGSFTSGTEEEFNIACQCHAGDAPMRQIVPLFRGVPGPQLADPGRELKKVLKFRKRLERERKFLYGTFDAVEEFKAILRKLLARWVRDHERNLPPDATTRGPLLPTRASTEVQRPAPTPDESSSYRMYKGVGKAERLAAAGKSVEAETAYAVEATRGHPLAITFYGLFLARLGRISMAHAMFERVLELGELSQDEFCQASAHANLAFTCRKRDNLDEAKQHYAKAVTHYEKAGSPAYALEAQRRLDRLADE